MCVCVESGFSIEERQTPEQKLQFYLGFKYVILQMSEPDEGQEGWTHSAITRVRLERWKDHEEPWDKVVLLCNSLRYLSTALCLCSFSQEIEPCVTEHKSSSIKIRSHNTLRQHPQWPPDFSPGGPSGSSRNPTKTKTGFSFHRH